MIVNLAPMRNLRAVVAYDGTAYHGWQRQAAGVDTVQERVEHAAVRVLGHPLAVRGASRTDAGVHALGQVASFRTIHREIPLANLHRAINSKLPPDIVLVSLNEAADNFHPSCATGKTYRYRIGVGCLKPIMRSNYVYHFRRPLSPERMIAAAARLAGTHDFRGFAFAAEQRENTVRTIWSCHVALCDDELHVTISGNGFLYKMVRNIVGTLLEIGRGHWDPDRIDQVLATRDRQYAGPTAPPNGLCLMHVFYPGASAHCGAAKAGGERLAAEDEGERRGE